MTLIIVHYHLRPGGIRRVIELTTPHLVRRLGAVERAVVLCGEARDQNWISNLADLLRPTPLEVVVHSAFGYVSEQRRQNIRAGIAATLQRLFTRLNGAQGVVWAHNLGVGRNLPLAQELTRACESHGIPLISHHHDLWFDNRWARWPEIQRTGFPTLGAIARTIFPAASVVRHAAINREDATILKRHFANLSEWLPNPASAGNLPSAARARAAKRWLQKTLNERKAPVWILPCRLLRRKNVAEALLLTRWLRPDAWLVTTGGASSRDEHAYQQRLENAAQKHGWRIRLGVLAGDESRKPSVPELLAASECVLLTSIREGFGLPYLEATAAQRPLIARTLPNIAPDLREFGFRFPQSYHEILIDTKLFNWERERKRQEKAFDKWKRSLPPELWRLAPEPAVLAARKKPRAVPFSRLSLEAQLEVLARPPGYSWELCAPSNPFLKNWRTRAAATNLQVTRWPKQATRILAGATYSEKFLRLVKTTFSARPRRWNAASVQMDFIRKKLAPENTYPLLWHSDV